MTALVPFLVFCQALGALGGACMAVWGELAYVRARRDGKIDVAERAHLDALAHGLRFGMTLVLLASFGLVIEAYRSGSSGQPALTTSYWTFILLALLIIVLSWLLSKRALSFALGSAAIFTGWWFLAYLALGWMPGLSFGAAVAIYVIATAVVFGWLHYLRFFTTHAS